MLDSHRRNVILDRLESHGRVRVSDLVERLHISDMTVRRDLGELEQEGLLIRVHGGAVLASLGETRSVPDRSTTSQQAKQRIAQSVVELIPSGSRLFLDSGTTVAAVAPLLLGRHVDVLTASLPVAHLLGQDPSIGLTVLGGRIRTQTQSTIGPDIETAIESFHADIALLGTSRVTHDAFFNLYPADVVAQQLMIRGAATSWLLADQSKWGTPLGARVSLLSQLTGIVTDADESVVSSEDHSVRRA